MQVHYIRCRCIQPPEGRHDRPPRSSISHKLCPYVQRAVIALDEKGVPFERIDIDLANKPDWFLKLSPLGKVPVLVVTTEQGEVALFESNVICEYIEETQGGLKLASVGCAQARRASRLDGVWLGDPRRSLGAGDDDRSCDVRRASGRRFAAKFARVEAAFGARSVSSPAKPSAWSTPCSRRCSAISTCSTKSPSSASSGMCRRCGRWRAELAKRPSVRSCGRRRLSAIAARLPGRAMTRICCKLAA